MSNRQHIQIIGGGIAGLSLALACKTNGIQYDLYEQHTAIIYDNVGLGISANLFSIFEKWGILEETKQLGTEINNFHFVDSKLKSIKSVVMNKPPLSVNRRLFYELLKAKLGNDNIHLNVQRSVSDFPESELVISAEGIYSQTRKLHYPQLELRDSNQILWRGISEIKLNENFKHAYYDFIGNNQRFAIIHLGHDYYSWYIIRNKERKQNTTADKQQLKEYFKEYHPVVGQVIEQSQEIYFSELKDIDPNNRKRINWFLNNNLLIGDAIHPTTPNMANGACLAMEDSYLLSNLLLDKSISNQIIFKEFQKQRENKINSVVQQSWMLGKVLHQKNSVIDYLLKAVLKITPKWFFNLTYSTVLMEIKDLNSREKK